MSSQFRRTNPGDAPAVALHKPEPARRFAFVGDAHLNATALRTNDAEADSIMRRKTLSSQQPLNFQLLIVNC